MATVYFNFPEISLGGNIDVSKEIILNDNRVTNIKFNEMNYTAYAVYITSGPDGIPTYLIVKCLSDINDTTSNHIYVAVPFRKTDNATETSDIDAVIKTPNRSKFELNKYIKDNGSCHFTDPNSFPITFTLGTDSAIPIQSYVGQNFYSISNLDTNIITDPMNGVLKKQEIDWVMSCELLTEDGPTEKEKVDPGSTATTITLFLMTILISGCAYIGGPVLYTELGMYKLAVRGLDSNHYSINVFWFITLCFMAFLCIIQGVSTNSQMLFFIAVGLILSYFSATRGVIKLDGVHNMNGDEFASTENPLRVYKEILFGDCYTFIGRIAKLSLFAVLTFVFFGIVGAMAVKNNPSFSSLVCVFLFFSLLQLASIYYFNRIANK